MTDDDNLALKVRMLANHGRIAKYDHEIEGVNSRLDGLQAAVLSVKLSHLPQWTIRRQNNASLYKKKYLGNNNAVVAPQEIDDVEAVYHLYVIRVKKNIREILQKHLKSKGIQTGVHYPVALPKLRAYSYLNQIDSEFPEAIRASHEILSLTMFPELQKEQIRNISGKITEFQA